MLILIACFINRVIIVKLLVTMSWYSITNQSLVQPLRDSEPLVA